MPDVQRELDLLVRSRYPLIYLVSWEERRVERAFRALARRLGKTVYFWTVTKGFDSTDLETDDTHDPLAVLRVVEKSSEKAIFVLKDFHPYLEQPLVVRALRDIVLALRSTYKTLVLFSPVLKIPPELEKDLTVVDYPLPSAAELRQVLEGILQPLRGKKEVRISPDAAFLEQAVDAALGLTESEAENVFAKAVVDGASFDEKDLPLILEEKKQIIRKSGLLEFYEHDESLASVGGLDVLKEWLQRRTGAFTEAARNFGLPAPKGLLLLGVQGCGKSVTAKCVASLFRMPLLRMDVGAVFNAFVGTSEANMRKAITTAESLAPCVLWIDEMEKGFSGFGSSGQVDAGVTSRVFSTFLTWLQEKTRPVFVVATANQIQALPPEMLRKGRFDEIFFVDLPNPRERHAIFAIHLAKRRRDPRAFDLDRLAVLSEGYSGAEIEQAIISALFETYALGRDIGTDDVVHAISETVPLSTTMAEQISYLRDWARNRTKPASNGG